MTDIVEHEKIRGRVHVELFGPDGILKEERFVYNTITELGDASVADRMSDAGVAAMSHMGIGTDDDPAPAAGNTTLNSEYADRHALTSTTQGAAGDDNDVIYVASWAAGHATTNGIVEAGIFNNAANGTMLCRAIFTAVNKGENDTLTITWTVTFGAS